MRAAHFVSAAALGLLSFVTSASAVSLDPRGIGLAKRDFMPRAIDPDALALMRRVRATFDPDRILNPGKLLPE